MLPFGFHLTGISSLTFHRSLAHFGPGMPIQAAADKLAREMAEFGTPPIFPEDGGDAVAKAESSASAVCVVDPTKFRSKKVLWRKQGEATKAYVCLQSKAVAKGGEIQREWSKLFSS